MQLDRDDLIEGLRDVVRRTHELGLEPISIRIVGGAALRLVYFERETTADIDAQIVPLATARPIIHEVARDRGWPAEWLNDNAAMFLPSWGAAVEWEPLYDDTRISISVAPLDALLAMKLMAARPGRDTEDIAQLLALTETESTPDAEALVERFYPGDALPDRAISLLDRIFAVGLPSRPPAPPRPDLAP